MAPRPLIFAISGGSGSGKTTFARKVRATLGAERCSVLSQDSYYLDQSSRFKEDGGEVNFDHPDSLEFGLLAEHLAMLRQGLPVAVPIYDFPTHTRRPESEPFQPGSVVLVDGILILGQPSVRAQLDASVFIDVPAQVRFERRLQRDIAERGRSPEGVKKQWDAQVHPMHEQFVEPSKAHATWIARDDASLEGCLREFSLREFSLRARSFPPPNGASN